VVHVAAGKDRFGNLLLIALTGAVAPCFHDQKEG